MDKELLKKDGTPRKMKKDGVTPKKSGGYHGGGAPRKPKTKFVGARIQEDKANALVKKYGTIKNAINTIC